MRLLRDLSLLVMLLPFSVWAQSLDTDLLLRSADGSANEVSPADLNPDFYKVKGPWREMTSDEDEDLPPSVATENTDKLSTDSN